MEQHNNIDDLFTAQNTQTRLATKVFYRIKFKHTIYTASDTEYMNNIYENFDSTKAEKLSTRC